MPRIYGRKMNLSILPKQLPRRGEVEAVRSIRARAALPRLPAFSPKNFRTAKPLKS